MVAISAAEVAFLLWCGLFATKNIQIDTFILLSLCSFVYGMVRLITRPLIDLTPTRKPEDAPRK